jgi:hypothetical protein
MNGATNVKCKARSQSCPAKAAFGYVDGGLEPYLDLAKSYGWANYMFQTNAVAVVVRRRSGRRSEEELMRREAGPLVQQPGRERP